MRQQNRLFQFKFIKILPATFINPGLVTKHPQTLHNGTKLICYMKPKLAKHELSCNCDV